MGYRCLSLLEECRKIIDKIRVVTGTNYLEVENGRRQVELVTTSLTNQTNANMQKVQDIVYLKPLQDDEVRQYVQKAKQEKDQTLEQLHQFDYEQAAVLSPVETDTHVMQSYIKEI